MDLKQFVEAKRTLEMYLAVLIQAEVNKFETATGQTPSNIDVRMVSSQQLGQQDAKHFVESVRVIVPL